MRTVPIYIVPTSCFSEMPNQIGLLETFANYVVKFVIFVYDVMKICWSRDVYEK